MEVFKNLNIGYCFLCLKNTNQTICEDCLEDMVSLTCRCPICARTSTDNKVCGHCIKTKPYFDQTSTLLTYQYPAKKIIKLIKYENRPELIKQLALLLAKRVSKNPIRPDVLVPVPLHRKRQQQRGYNQSREMAHYFSVLTGIKTDLSLCKRVKDTRPQSMLPIKERKQNINSAFKLLCNNSPNHIAIIDDVMTSGATVNEIAKLFKRAGCESVSIWVLART